MKEVLYDYEEFKGKALTEQPIHHSFSGSFIDRDGLIYMVKLRVYGVSKQGGHVIVFETKRRLNTLSKEFNDKWHGGDFRRCLNNAVKAAVDELEHRYTKPVGQLKANWNHNIGSVLDLREATYTRVSVRRSPQPKRSHSQQRSVSHNGVWKPWV